MDRTIAKWGVELSLFRTIVGKEFEVVKRLRRSYPNPSVTFFGAYGYFDLAAIRSIVDLAIPTLLPLDCDVVEAAPFRFFADSANDVANPAKSNFQLSLENWDAAIAVFLKVSPSAFASSPNRVRWNAAQIVRSHFPTGHVFFGLGFSEILLLVGGTDLPDLLRQVTCFRQLHVQNTSTQNHGECTNHRLYFIKTATFPFISHERIHKNRKYKILQGRVYPVVTMSCDPASEGSIINLLPEDTIARNAYGDTDLVVYWNREVDFAHFANALTKIRNIANSIPNLRKTTSYLETSAVANTNRSLRSDSVLRAPNYRKIFAGITEELYSLLDAIDSPSLRASVSDLCLRLFSCHSDPHLESTYQDMANVIPFVMSVLRTMADPTKSQEQKRDAASQLSMICDQARIAINQRYAGVEIHPETLAHSQSPELSDIRSLISAATCIPHFIFDNLMPGRSAERVWAGYVIFGTTYSHRWQPQDILALPASAVYDPINQWWKTTHEAAHAVFRMLKVEKLVKSNRNLYQRLNCACALRTVETVHMQHEIFANWFDWRYIFDRDTQFFLKAVWDSWIKLPVVSESKHQYLNRTFAIVLAERFDDLTRAYDSESHKVITDYFLGEWCRFVGLISKSVLGFNHYVAEFLQSTDALVDLTHFSAALAETIALYEQVFEKRCRLDGLSSRLNPRYPRLSKHLNMLERGQVITEEIPNPCKLQLELLRRESRKRASLATQGAFVLSMENEYLSRTRRRL